MDMTATTAAWAPVAELVGVGCVVHRRRHRLLDDGCRGLFTPALMAIEEGAALSSSAELILKSV
jgi:hypothetical protein